MTATPVNISFNYYQNKTRFGCVYQPAIFFIIYFTSHERSVVSKISYVHSNLIIHAGIQNNFNVSI